MSNEPVGGSPASCYRLLIEIDTQKSARAILLLIRVYVKNCCSVECHFVPRDSPEHLRTSARVSYRVLPILLCDKLKENIRQADITVYPTAGPV